MAFHILIQMMQLILKAIDCSNALLPEENTKILRLQIVICHCHGVFR